MGQFDGKVVLVTGGSSGIGQSAAILLAGQGAKIMVSGRNAAKGQETVDIIRKNGKQADFTQANVVNATEVEALIAATIKSFGRLDHVVHSAGAVGSVANTVDCTEENWQDVIQTNITGAWHVMKYAIPEILKVGGGSIVNIASVIGVIAFPGLPAYTASKAGMIALTKTTALEYAKQNIRVNVICPGSIRTPMFMDFSGGTPESEVYMASFHPMGRIGEPNEVASAIEWLLSDGASFVTGHVLPVAGGWEVP